MRIFGAFVNAYMSESTGLERIFVFLSKTFLFGALLSTRMKKLVVFQKVCLVTFYVPLNLL